MKKVTTLLLAALMLCTIFSGCSSTSIATKIENVSENTQISSQMQRINEMMSSLKSSENISKYKKQISDMLNTDLKSKPGFVGVNAENIKFTKVKDGFGRPYFGASVDVSVAYKLNGKTQKKTEKIIVAYDILTNSWRILDGGSVEN